MSFEDKSLTCSDCGNTFTFTTEEQETFASKGYTNNPKRCPECREARRASRNRNENSGYRYGMKREMFPVVCSECGKDTQVPFEPRSDRPVYCSDCYNKVRLSRQR